LIIYEGKASIVFSNNKIADAGSGTVIGEQVLEYKQKRKASLLS
jgi:hypothetical protein